MDYVWFLEQIFITIIIPLLGILTVFIINCINKYTAKLKAETDNELAIKYIGILNDIIVACVVATNQTYVNSLKEQNKFDAEAQKIAFEMTYKAVTEILSDEMVSILSELYEDLDQYIRNQIEFIVNTNKQSFFNERQWNEENEPIMDYNYN